MPPQGRWQRGTPGAAHSAHTACTTTQQARIRGLLCAWRNSVVDSAHIACMVRTKAVQVHNISAWSCTHPLHIHAVADTTPLSCARAPTCYGTTPIGSCCSGSRCMRPRQPGSLPGLLTPTGHQASIRRKLSLTPLRCYPPLPMGLTLPAAAQGPGPPAPSLPGSCTPVCH
jgi:hypothetical protein